MSKDVVPASTEVAQHAMEGEILPGRYEPVLPPATTHLGRSIFRRVVESALETFFPVIGSAVAELYRHSHPSLADRIRDIWQEDVTRRLNRLGSTLEAHEIVLRDLQSFVISEAHYEYAGQAGQLSFFHTGMWGQLRRIADGNADATTMSALATGLQDTDKEVEVLVASLTAARDIMRGQPENIAFALRLDAVLYGPIGKMGIRYDIERLLERTVDSPSLQQEAAQLCEQIQQFNKSVTALAFEQRS